ncbi:unnamed protein product [Arabidopsis halleri]
MMRNRDMLFHHQQQQQQVEENMSNLTSASGDQASVSSGNRTETSGSNINQRQEQCFVPQSSLKRKRNQPGNPDPEAEVMALSPKTLMATNRFICEVCNKGFQRDQNLQLHKRGHNLPWKLKQRSTKDVIRKKVYVCPEPSCVHHHPSRALGDLTGIKKHFFRKHGEKKWKCEKCSKKYAVQSDWKAHAKTCGTKEYRCDCGTLFSRRDSFITHRAFCDALAEESARAIPNPIMIQASDSPHHLHHHQTQQNISFSASSSQNITSNSNLHGPMKQEESHHHFQNIPPWLVSSNPNPNGNNGNLFPPLASSANTGRSSFHQPLPAMSATALLQKAAQMGSTKSTTPEEEERSSRSSYNNLITTTMAAMMTSPPEPGFGFQDYYMMNHQHHGGGEAFNGAFVPGEDKNDVVDDGGGETRDFLGLRSLMSHNEILSFANNFGNCLNTSASEQEQQHSHQD